MPEQSVNINEIPLPPRIAPVSILGESTPVEAQPIEIEKPKPKNDLADLFSVPAPEDNDMYVDDLIESPGEDDMSDLTRVTNEDIMGTPRKRKVTRRFIRTNKPYNPTSLGGMR